MSHGYVPVQWNRNKKIYDLAILGGIILYVIVFMMVSKAVVPANEAISPMTLLIRAFGSLGFIMLTIILCIGPLARIDKRFLPMLYNRRHLGVSMFFVILIHGLLVLMWYHGFGAINPIESLFTSPGSFSSAVDAPFQPLGFFALVILFVMAATSHDYWNANLGAPVWKAIHMMVYVAYGLIIAHVAFGAMQDEAVGLLPALVIGSVLLVGGVHIAAGLRYSKPDIQATAADWIKVGTWQSIRNDSARVIEVNDGERIAVFRYEDNKLAAVSNVCQHQNGPLGEGCVKDGLITCPWHGFQYKPEDGRSPAPFTEKISTYELKLEGDEILLNPTALPPGTARPVIEINDAIANEAAAEAN